MSNVTIAGVIMPENFWLEDNVTTLAGFSAAMSECEDGIDLHIDSQGGDVITSNIMSTMLADWCLRHPNAKCTCTIGGICASAAFNIVAKLPACFDIACHEDSLFMAHSCYGTVEGSPETLRDNAVLMDLVNAVVIQKLLSKTTLDEDRVRTAFRAGRELWLDGKEAVACGLAGRLVDGASDTSVRNAEYAGQGTDAYRYAACIAHNIKSKLEARIMAENKDEMVAKATEEEEVVATATVAAEETDEPKKEEAPVAECGKEEPKAEEESPVTDEDADDAPEEEVDAMAALKAENESLKAEIQSLKSIVAKYQVEVKPEAPKTTKTFAQLIREIPKGLSQAEYAKRYSALKAEHKAEYDAFMASHTTR